MEETAMSFEACKIILEDKEGRRIELEQGLVIYAERTDDPSVTNFSATPVNMGMKALKAYLYAALEMGARIGLFDESEEDSENEQT